MYFDPVLHLVYIRSSIFKKPNPLAFNITLPAKGPSTVPPGITNPKTFLEVGRYLHSLLVTEINSGSDPFLNGWKNRPQAFNKLYQAQFTAYAQGSYPFTTPLSLNQSPLEWWSAYEGTDNGGLLAVCFLFFYSVRSLIRTNFYFSRQLQLNSTRLPPIQWLMNEPCHL